MSEEQMEQQAAVAPEAVEAVEKEAQLLGWIPQEEFKGPPEKWRPAEEFLEEGKRINGFLRKDMDKLRAELAKRDGTVAEMQRTMREFASFHQQTEQKAYERALRALKDERKEALREGDGAKVVEIEDQMDQLAEAAPQVREQAPAAKAPPTEDPVWVAWVGENAWFRDNVKLRAISNGYGDIVRAENPTLVGRPFLEEVKRRVQEDFPEHFQNGERKKAAAVGGSGESRGTGGKGYASLPQEAKDACDRFVKQGLVPSREAYVKDYFGGEA
jgi:hypothetical protein